jgi:hypothetical protein
MLGTADGLRELDFSGATGRVAHPGRRVSAVAPEGWELWAILDGREVWHTAGIDWWFHVANFDGLRANCLAHTRAGVVVGTSEAHLYRVAGEGLERVPGFDTAEGRHGWYTPWGGPPDTRSISEDGDAVYVNVHVGGVLRSRDHGNNWEPTIDVDHDVHRVGTGSGQVLAACAHGLAVSQDQGESWTLRAEGLHAHYCRAVAVCGDSVLLSASTGPGGGRAAVYRGRLDRGRFERCRNGLPEWFDENIDTYRLDAIPDRGLAAFALSDGRVYASEDEGASWRQVATGVPEIECLLLAP